LPLAPVIITLLLYTREIALDKVGE
jgi:hypothetical protein